jgi:hypothetical protein
MIGDEHEHGGSVCAPQPPRGVGDDQDAYAQLGHHPHRERHGLRIVTLVEVKTPALEQNRDAVELARHHFAAVPSDPCGRKAWELAKRDCDSIARLFDERSET